MNRKQNRLQEKDREKHLNTPLKDPHANFTRATEKAEDRYGKVKTVFTRPERQKLLDEGISAVASAQSSLHAMGEPEFKPLFTYSPRNPLYIWLLESAVELKATFSLGGAKHHLADFGFNQQGFGFPFMVDNNLRIKDSPVFFIGSQPNKEKVDRAAADIGAVIITGNVEHVLISRSEKQPFNSQRIEKYQKGLRTERGFARAQLFLGGGI